MLLDCPECHAAFRVAAEKLGNKGRKVRCSQCAHEWVAVASQLRPDSQEPLDSFDEMHNASSPAEDAAVMPPAVEEDLSQEELALRELENAARQKQETSQSTDDIQDGDVVVEESLEVGGEPPAIEATMQPIVDENGAGGSLEEQSADGEAQPEPEFDLAALEARMAREQARNPVRHKQQAPLWPFALVATMLLLTGVASIGFAMREQWRSLPGGNSLLALLSDAAMDGVLLEDVNIAKLPLGTRKTRYFIAGTVLNTSSAPRALPVLRIAVRDASGTVINERVISKEGWLQPGERKPFTYPQYDVVSTDADHFTVDIGSDVQVSLRR